jgi:ribose 1,5-bisphosphokinase
MPTGVQIRVKSESAGNDRPRAITGGGTLALVVGPSGAGKDTIMDYARERLARRDGIVFQRRVVTRAEAAPGEDHVAMRPEQFTAAVARGEFALTWAAHGLFYGIPAGIRDDLAAGRLVIVNLSRTAIMAAERLAERCVIFNITAAPDVLARRIAGRGRESVGEIALRLTRDAPITASHADVVEIRNETTVEAAGDRFVAHLENLIAAR